MQRPSIQSFREKYGSKGGNAKQVGSVRIFGFCFEPFRWNCQVSMTQEQWEQQRE